ncbi:hypothetical protein BH10CYA1_BH10CYA1_40320 [soil metagenome]
MGGKVTTSSSVGTNSSQSKAMLVPILLGGGVVTRAQLEKAQSIAAELNLSLEEALVQSGLENNDSLVGVSVEALKQVEENKISLDQAIRAVRLVGQKKVSLSQAIKSVEEIHEHTRPIVSTVNELTELMLSAKMVSREDLIESVKKSQEASMMIGQYLVLEQKVTAVGLIAALNGVFLIRDSGLDKEKAAQGLRYANQRDITFEQALFELGFFIHADSKTTRIDELFDMAGLLSQEEIAECFEIQLFKKKNFGQILLERGIVSQEQLDSAITLLASISNATLKPFQAAEALRQVCKDREDVYATIAIFQLLHKVDLNFRLGDMLAECGACTRSELEAALEETGDGSIKIGKALLKSKLLSEAVLFQALRVQTLLRFGYISRDNAIDLIACCIKKDCKLELAFSEVGVRVPSRMQWTWV